MNSPNPLADTPRMRSIIVLGSGELGMAVLRRLSGRAADASVSIAVLLRPETFGTADSSKRADIDELLGLGCELVPGDIASAWVAGLAGRFGRHDAVLSCIGFAAGRGTQLKLACVMTSLTLSGKDGVLPTRCELAGSGRGRVVNLLAVKGRA